MTDSRLAKILLPDKNRSREEPEIAANISAQLVHMSLTTWSISVLRRIRDVIGRIRPENILELGGGIGHRTAWIMDLIDGEIDYLPARYTIVEEGSRFGIIIKRLLSRFDAESWADVVVGDPPILCGETRAWSLAGVRDVRSPLPESCDCIIIDTSIEKLVPTIESCIPLLSEKGLIITLEPEVPTGDKPSDDLTVVGFNAWIECIKSLQTTHSIGFTPLYGGTLVVITSKS